jgi:hypothetical protein
LTCETGAALRIRRRWSWAFQKRPHLPEAKKKLPQNAASAAMVKVGGWLKVLGNTQKVKSKDQVGTRRAKERLKCPVQKIQAEVVSF